MLITDVLPVDLEKIQDPTSIDSEHLHRAAQELRQSDIPVAFPTETVYGLGADATRSAAVQGIYKAKQRPSDNPLIVHIHSLNHLSQLLRSPTAHGSRTTFESSSDPGPVLEASDEKSSDHIPDVYRPLIERFWPGPLTLIVPNPEGSALAPEVTAGLTTFGVRMPSNALALQLIRAADIPTAAPSANSSSKPSPTTAGHVKHDLDGRISTILDGGPCTVGVESTVVTGLSDPPLILRPGRIGIEELRSCPGWENVQMGYKDTQQAENKPLAPGMKYKHYSPHATVILFEAGRNQPSVKEMTQHGPAVGLVRTITWKSPRETDLQNFRDIGDREIAVNRHFDSSAVDARDTLGFIESVHAEKLSLPSDSGGSLVVWDIYLGTAAQQIAHGLFSALRELDQEGVSTIFVEGIDDQQGDVAAAVMNRLRKAAQVEVPT